ncbi:tetratricopeptide repeat protein [Adhaeretor mobilis]|uniref:Uncharacterized protein n=1 Tax=Adhaeretor mobilis TaxID=1930276 RepID=A0A517N1M0_9BACT|nr:tetratricopeptide repeat protein [Adhaeretor mobilis]QDT01025.1 hypothetical protein HG15A2_43670 [Adhaeretor mobilis]
MTISQLLFAALIAFALLLSPEELLAQASTIPSTEELDALISQLGDDEYHVREAAEQQLLQLGHEAFDQLKQNERHRDLEIASRVSYILHKLQVDWLRDDDPTEVRRILARYNELNQEERRLRIEQLVALPEAAGAPAIARVARFEASPEIARLAALQLTDMDPAALKQAEQRVLQECGTSKRTPIEWIRLIFVELNSPAETVARWAAFIESEIELVATEGQDKTSSDIVYLLLDHELKLCNRLELLDETTASLVRSVELTSLTAAGSPQLQRTRGLIYAIDWITENERWDVLEQFESRFEKEICKERLVLYYLANAYGKQGKGDAAETTATKAWDLIDDDDEQRVALGGALQELGRLDWAKREWRYVIDGFAEIDPLAMSARQSLALWLHDSGNDREAADLLAASCDALDKNPGEKKKLHRTYLEHGNEPLAAFYAQRLYYEACYYQSLEDYKNQAKKLEQAAAAYEDNADILIAMYHAQGSDEDYRKRTLARIRRVSRKQQELIDSYPHIAGLYNQWAWLIGNTEGDYQKAIAYSQKSLELSPGEAGFQDTLAHCYFTAGNYEKAVEFQRLAVAGQPYVQVMQRKLVQFEKELEKRREKGLPTKPVPEKAEAS